MEAAQKIANHSEQITTMKYYLQIRNDRTNPRGLKITQGKNRMTEEEKHGDASSEEDDWQDQIELEDELSQEASESSDSEEIAERILLKN